MEAHMRKAEKKGIKDFHHKAICNSQINEEIKMEW